MSTLRLAGLRLDAHDPPLLAAFWGRLLGRARTVQDDGAVALEPDSADGWPKITWSGPPFMPRPERDRWGFLLTADGPIDAAVEHLTSLGATVAGRPGRASAVLSDLEGYEITVEQARP